MSEEQNNAPLTDRTRRELREKRNEIVAELLKWQKRLAVEEDDYALDTE